MTRIIDYTLKLVQTRSSSGYFQALPEKMTAAAPNTDFDTLTRLLELRPMDSFLHRFVLDKAATLEPHVLKQKIETARVQNRTVVSALLLEQVLIRSGHAGALALFSDEEIRALQPYSPMIIIRSFLLPTRRLHRQWVRLFHDNLTALKPLPPPSTAGLPQLCTTDCQIRTTDGDRIQDLYSDFKVDGNPDVPALSQTLQTAQECLSVAGVILEQEMRHQASLSPIALMQSWRLDTRVECNRNRYTLTGTQTSYGKGLSLEAARVSLKMEIVERYCSFASIQEGRVQGTRKRLELTCDTLSGLTQKGKTGLDPNRMALEIEYQDEALYWIPGQSIHTEGPRPRDILIPLQAVYLFSNQDEIDLFSGLGSTGLASGSTPAQAKASALLEVVERHQESTVPFDPSNCFRLLAHDDILAPLLHTYTQLGVDLLFQDITPPSGIPCCRCYVRDRDGVVHRGAAAHLDARRAVISAITEVPYPFPKSPPSMPFKGDFAPVGFDTLPDYTTGSPDNDLALLETLLLSQGRLPCYVDLTRKDLGLPVFRALVPGMEILGDLDRYSRVHPELFSNYLKTCKGHQ